jgi:hypothetical protein
LELPPLSDIVDYIHLNHDRPGEPIAPQTVANILRDWGLRIPSPRPRGGNLAASTHG